ncbi:MAG: cupin domain-containing protein [Bacteroidales bacterium]|jgi:quercetin dioxygenase-like cupin family protein|nr:cupin domain-containing protein [Bacteroidales bacterium]
MNRKSFLLGLSAAGIVPFVSGHSLLRNIDSETGTPVMLAPDLNNSYWYIGTLISILLSAKDTGGAFSLLHGYEIQGLEPPPHIHTQEDESFYILDGEITYTAGGKVMKATRGSWVFLPRNIEHSFRVMTPRAEVLIHLSPGGFEEYFIEMSDPAAELVIPPMPQGPPDVRRIVETASRYGIRFPGLT